MAFLRPSGDDVDGGWTDQAGGTSLFAAIDEASVDDADYIQSPEDPAAETCRVAMGNPVGTPVEPFTLRYRYNAATDTQLTVRLVQGASTEIASWTETATGWNTVSHTLTTPQFALITDWSDLFVEFTADTTAVGPAPVVLTFLSSTSSTADLTTYTFTGVSFGDEANFVVGYAGRNSVSNTLVSSIKVHVPNVATDPTGTALTAVVQVANQANVSAIFAGPRIASTGDVTVTLTNSGLRCFIAFYKKTAGASATFTGTSTVAAPTATLAVPVDGAVLGVALTATPSSSTPTNFTEDADVLVESAITATCASTNTASGITPFTFTFGSAVSSSGVFAAWLPGDDPTLALDLDFTLSDTLDSRVTFTRSTTATYFNAAGLVASAAIDAARFDHDPVTLEPRGLLMGAQRTNLFLQSQQFSAACSANDLVLSDDSGVAPDGSTTADQITDDAGSSYHQLFQTVAVSDIGPATVSFYAKAGTGRYLGITLAGSNTSDGASATIDLVAGTVTRSAALGTGTLHSATIEALADGWYRITLASSTTVSNTHRYIIFSTATVAVPTVDGLGRQVHGFTASTWFLWGAQLEVGSFATSYIPTTTAAVTRAADVAIMTGSNFSSWYNQPEGTILLEAIFGPQADSTDRHYLNLNNNTESERHILQGVVNTLTVAGAMVAASSLEAYAGVGSYTATQLNKFAYAYKLNDFGACLNGGTVGTDTSCVMPTPNRAGIGRGPSGIETPKEWWLSRFAFYNVRKSNAELQAITAP